MRRPMWLWALAFLCFTDCPPVHSMPPKSQEAPAYGTMYICLLLPKEQMKAAEAAVDTWDTVLHKWRALVAIEGQDSACKYWVYETLMQDPDDAIALAWASALGGSEIFMRKGHYELDTQAILTHELGHIFGAQHIDGTLMSPNYDADGWHCPDIITVAQVAAYNKLPLTLLKWCQ